MAIRQIRKDTNNHLKDIEKNEKLPEDIKKKTHKDVQDMTDKMIETINGIFEKKQKEVLEI